MGEVVSPTTAAGARQLTAQGQDRRADIVRHAEELFGEHGYARTRMSDIAAAAGVTKGLLYWYFESKEALIGEILVDIRQRLRAEQRAAVAGIDDPLERMYLATAASVRFILGHYRLYRVAGEDLKQLAGILGESGAVHAGDAARTIKSGQELGVVRDDDTPQALAYANSGVVNQLCASAYAKRIPGSPEEVAHLAARYVVRALAADAALADGIAQRHSSSSQGGRVVRSRAARANGKRNKR